MPEEKIPRKWYWKTSTLVIAVLSVGPLALPLVWFNPHLSRTQKIIYTVIMAGVSYFLIVWSIQAYNKYMKIYSDILQQMP